jgi:hypothetical protein
VSKQQYRTEIGIIRDILALTTDSGRQGVRVTYLANMVNLSHYAAMEKIEKKVRSFEK